jgi:hypothetical protein
MSKLMLQKKNEYTGLLIMALIVAIFSFPEIELEYTIGIDPPLKWLYNHLFSEGLSIGRSIIFPHGPLAFFMYPLADNFILSVVVTILLQVVFVFQLFYLFGKEKWQYWVLTALLAWFIFSISNFNQLIISNVSVAYLLFLKNEKPFPKYWGLVLTAFAFYVKAYVAIIAGTLTFSLLAIDFLRNRNYKRSLIDTSALLVTMLLIWLLMYNQPTGFINYCVGMFHLAGDNSAAAAFNPTNNWLLVVPLLAVVWIVPFLQKTGEGKMFGFLFSLSFFAAWKYGMAREDYFHVRTYLFFITISMIFFLIYNRKKPFVNVLILGVVIVLFAVNMKNVENPQPLAINYSGIGNFIKFVSSFSEIKETSDRQNLENIARNRLPEAVRNQIGDATVDIYPWDYTIVAANQLNWKPRPVIQSYAAYTSWLDKKNADHFASNDAPEYFVFGLNNITYDLNGGKLESIDNRYLLNDEPQTLIELIRNYDQFFYNENFLVYRKRKLAIEIHSVITKPQSAGWHEWIAVPDSTNHFTRLKLHLDRSFSGRIKSFLFKDELYYMYFKTLDGSILKYRIVPQNAVAGIWISPFYTSAGNHSPAKMIKEVSMTCSDKYMVKKSFSYEWEYFDTDAKTMNNFFGKDSMFVPEVYVNEDFNVESEHPNWTGFNAKNVTDDPFENQKYYQVEPEGFSPAFKFKTDSLPKLPMRITVDCWLKTDRNAHSNLVIETENAAGEKNWQGIEINRQIIDQEELNHVFSFMDLKLPIAKVTVYIWNNGKKPVMIYEMNVKMIKNITSFK